MSTTVINYKVGIPTWHENDMIYTDVNKKQNKYSLSK